VDVRVLFAPSQYVASDGNIFFNPGPSGLVGGDAASDQLVTLELFPPTSAEDFNGHGNMQQGPLHLPVFDDDEFSTIPYILTNYPSPIGSLSGVAYAGVDGFTAYLLGVDGDVENPFYGLTGTPTDVESVFEANADPVQVRRYSYTADPIQGTPVPFMLDAMPSYDNLVTSDFFVIDTPDLGDSPVRMFQSWLVIDGQGEDQVSAVGVNVLNMFDEAGGFSTGRRGSYRPFADSTSFSMAGGVASVPMVNGEGSVFGENGENMVLSTEIAINDYMGDSGANMAEFSGGFSTIHVLNLVETGVADPLRSDRELSGFSAGVVDEVVFGDGPGSGEQVPVPMMSSLDDVGIDLRLDPTTNNVGGAIRVSDLLDLSDLDTLKIGFGFDPIAGNNASGGAYIDDDNFGARVSANSSSSFVERGGETYHQRTDGRTHTYMVSADAVPQSGFMGMGSQICECDFLEWGWWGTQVQYADGNVDPDQPIGVASTHLGTWVAGDIVDYADLPTIGSASYTGHAIGSVINGTSQYIAGGTMEMTWNFGPRNGQLDITNFDGRDFGWAVSDPSGGVSMGAATFSGNAVGGPGVSPYATGVANGAFVRNGLDATAGVIGNFGVVDGSWRASGTFAGQNDLIGF
jgi:hypothetical protein